ncbi:gamma-tubulin complex component GCP5, putative [Paecilomyces variotii No. 5]|uniref:Spindle pole body component n=1 Tax=Byssochlamys spectabilis (strain No. 5 / NBRC 109023) TaxID=1356009 RepID=V5FR01_BYSSN|nr:gamma-tubulin complex component GCP5, putative [Paecilomyces variotii No. 5]
MAPAADISALLDDLITAITKTSDKASCAPTASRFKRLKSNAESTIKNNRSTRTDQFAVARQLDGLQEKFQVLNNDDLADALRIRLDELNQHESPYFPEILSLFLQLSDKPAALSKVDRVELLKSREPSRPLTWSEFDPTGAAYCDDDIWDDIDYGEETSDDDLSTVSSDVSIPRIVPQSSKVAPDDYIIPEEVFSQGEDEDLISAIKRAQFWKTEAVALGGDYSCFVTELQVVRETIFMLQGLPTSLYWRLDGSIEVDRRYALRHSSNQAFSSLLRSFSSLGAQIDGLRSFVNIPQSILYIQTFHRGIQDCLSMFDAALSSMHARYLSQSRATAVSLLQLFEDVRRESRLLIPLANLLETLRSRPSQESFECLDRLYDLVCTCQAAGADDEFAYFARLFFSCFDSYIKPIRLWMETGQLDTSQGTFFVSEAADKSTDLRTLWHDWYTLDQTGGRLHAPKFLKPAAQKVFTTGKSMIFLRNLNMAPENLEGLGKASLSFEDVCPDDSSLLVPFSGLLETAFDRLIEVNHAFISSLLRRQLGSQCGLWISLQALEYIYLCKDVTISSSVDYKIFELIDKGRRAWNDRFLITELVQEVFGELPCVDTSRLIMRSSPGPYRDVDNRARSVKILKSLSIDYILPWPVANIITKDAIQAYQRIYTFLLQIRRAKYVVSKQRLQRGRDWGIEYEDEDDNLGYAIRHNLLWFINILYSHLTEMVISTTTAKMQKDLSAAKDVDAMITVHQSYMTSLEDQCLLSKNLSPIHQAVISLLDLCIHFSDIQASRHGENQFDQTNRSFGASVLGYDHSSHGKKRRRKRQTAGDDTSDDDDDGEDGSEYDEGNTTGNISFADSPYGHRLRSLKSQYERLLAFVAAGLRGVGRVDGKLSWEMLAERLEWKKERFAGALV